MRIITVRDGLDKGKFFLVTGDVRQYISTPAILDDLKAAGIPVSQVSTASWALIINGTVLDAVGLRDLPPERRLQVTRIEEGVKALGRTQA